MGDGLLRAWDGSRWTSQTRPAHDGELVGVARVGGAELRSRASAPAQAVPISPSDRTRTGEPGPRRPAKLGAADRNPTSDSRRSKRGKDGTNAIIVVLLLLFAFSGVYEVVTGSSSGANDPTRFATPTTPASSGASVPSGTANSAGTGASSGPTVAAVGPCANQPAALILVLDLENDRFPVSIRPTATLPAAAAPSGPTGGTTCSAVTFADRRGQGTSRLAVYPSPADAAKALGLSGQHPASVQVDSVVVVLDPSLLTLRSTYATAVARFVGTRSPSR